MSDVQKKEEVAVGAEAFDVGGEDVGSFLEGQRFFKLGRNKGLLAVFNGRFPLVDKLPVEVEADFPLGGQLGDSLSILLRVADFKCPT